MIFLCGNCQAKYQLPDERVAGRTVRMKCRKCGHLIEAKGPPAHGSDRASTAPASATASIGWYVGIDGQPAGPMSMEELAEKLQAGAITRDSLVFREGLEGWQALSTIAELAKLVAEETEPEVVAEPSPPLPPPAPPSAPRVVPAAPIPPRPSIAGIPPRPPAARTSALPISSRLSSAAPKLDVEEPTPAPEPTLTLAPEPAPPLLLAPTPVPEPAAPTPSFAPPPSLAPDRAESLVIPIPAQRRGVHPAAWAMVGLGGVLIGIFAGLSLAQKPTPEAPDPVASAPIAREPAPTTAEPAGEPIEPEATADELVEEPAPAPAEPSPSPGKAAAARAEPQKPKQAAAPTTTTKGAAPAMTGLSGLSGLAAGPAPGPGKTSSTGGRGALSQAEVERVVQSHRAFVKRRCWELALATKTQGAPSSARVATTITIAPDGRVTNASATGGDGYPGLASCVAGQVRGWKFPPSEGGTVNVPFVFAAQ